MSKEFKIKFYSDPGHGWGAVKRSVINELNLGKEISRYSYQKGKSVYLEEDADLLTVVTRLRELGYVVKFEESSTDKRSPIRSYDSYKE